MLEQPDSPTASETKKQVFDHYLYRLQSEIHAIIASEQDYEDRVKALENELGVFKQACLSAESEKRALKEKLEKIESQLLTTEKRIICLIDGDGTVFSPEIVRKGRDGGRLAAKLLTESVQYHLLPNAPVPCHLWTYVFFSKHGLMDTFARASLSGGDFRAARDALDEFVLGFNQACERFAMVDVGSGKEAAEAKMKAHLDLHAHSSETYKVIFGGCHDNGYVPHLQALLTSGIRDKLVLLPGYDDMGVDIHKLQLPSLVIPGLFLPEKIVLGPKEARALSHSRQSSLNSSQQKSNQVSATSTGITSQTTVRERSVSDLGPPPGLPPPLLTPPSSDSEHTDSDSESQRGGPSTPPPPPPYHDPRSPSPIQDSPGFQHPKSRMVNDTMSNLMKENLRAASVSAIADNNSNNVTNVEIVNSTSPSLPFRSTAMPTSSTQRTNASGPVNYRPRAHSNLSAQARRFTLSSGEYYPSQYDEQQQQVQMGIAKNENRNDYQNMMKQKRINRELALSQHSPPPCTLFYLAANGCKHGAECRFGHEYILDDEDYELLRKNARKVPCPAANRGEYCVFGDDCCYGHYCPQQDFPGGCPYFKRGKCKFAGAGMHRET